MGNETKFADACSKVSAYTVGLVNPTGYDTTNFNPAEDIF